MKKSSKVNVLYIHNSPSGGAGESLYQMIYKNNLWKTKGIFFGQGGYLKEKFGLLEPNVIINYYNTRSWLSSVKNVKWLFWPTKIYQSSKIYLFYKKIKGFVKRQQIDIIHTNTITILEGGLVAKHKNIPHFIQVRELVDLEYYQYLISKKTMLRILSNYVDVFIANSERTKQSLLKYDVDENKIRVIYNAVSKTKHQLDIREHLNLPYDSKIVAIVGWISPNKMVEDFLDVAANLENRDNTKFIIIGGFGLNDLYNKRIKNKIQNLSNVLLTGILTNATEYMESFDVLLCTCYTESFGRTVAEALIEGTPAIGIKSCAVAEIIQHEKSGFLVEKSDITALTNYTKLLLDDEVLNAEMGAYGMKDVEQRFGIETIRNQFLELYKEYTKN